MITPDTTSPRPIEPWFVGRSVLDAPARIGFVYAPGRRHPAAASPDWNRDLSVDLRTLREGERVDVLVSLMEPHEMVAVGIDGLPRLAREHGMEWIGFPIPDMGIPAGRADYERLLEQICERLRAGRVVVLHCLGGLGRSGMVAASVLTRLGLSADEAIAEVRRSRPGAIQTVAQERLVRDGAN